MNPSEAFNFGRRIKDLKRTYNKTYADLTAALKISRERIIQLEENEREPTELERRRFADFYSLPLEELGVFSGGGQMAPPPRQYDNRPSYSGPSGNYGGPPSGMDRRGNYEPRGGNYDMPPSGNYNDRPPRTGGQGNFQPRSSGPGNFQPRSGGPGNFPPRSGNAPQRPAGRVQDEVERPAKPPKAPKPKSDSKSAASSEPKPVMKYTAEQLGDIESAYLRKQRDLKVPLKFTFLNGQEYTGVVIDFTPFTVHIIDQSNGEEVILRKLAMAYYRKADALEEAKGLTPRSDEG
jgi:hypothetical protein